MCLFLTLKEIRSQSSRIFDLHKQWGEATGGCISTATRNIIIYQQIIIYFIFSSEFIGLMTQSKQVQIAAQQFIPWIAISPILCAGAFMLDGIFIGITQIKQMRNSMFFAGICWGSTLLLSYRFFGYHAIWLAMSTFMFCRTLFLGYYLIRVFQTIHNWPKPRDPSDSNRTIPLVN